jgi:hypothetical protein
MRKGRKPTWKVIDRGKVPDPAPNEAMLTCLDCGAEAALPVVGIAIAQLHQGLVFDVGEHAIPRAIQCRRCHHRYETEA